MQTAYVFLPPCLKFDRASLGLGKRRVESSGMSSFPLLSLNPPQPRLCQLHADSRLRCEARLLGFCFAWDLVICQIPSGVSYFSGSSPVSEFLWLRFSVLRENSTQPPPTLARETIPGWRARDSQHRANALGISSEDCEKVNYCDKILPARSENKWSML